MDPSSGNDRSDPSNRGGLYGAPTANSNEPQSGSRTNPTPTGDTAAEHNDLPVDDSAGAGSPARRSKRPLQSPSPSPDPQPSELPTEVAPGTDGAASSSSASTQTTTQPPKKKHSTGDQRSRISLSLLSLCNPVVDQQSHSPQAEANAPEESEAALQGSPLMIQSPTIDPVATGQQAEEEVLGDEPGRSTEQVAGASGLPGPPKRKAFRRNTGKDDRWLIVTYDEPDWSLAENSGEEEDTDSRDYVKSTRVNQQCILCLECRVTISFTGRPSGPTPGSTNFLEHFSKGKCTGRPTVQPEGDRTKPCKVCERRSRRAGLNGEPHPELGFHYSKKDMERHKHHGAERSKYTRQEVYFQISITDTLLTPHRKLGEGYVYRVLKEKGEAVVGERS